VVRECSSKPISKNLSELKALAEKLYSEALTLFKSGRYDLAHDYAHLSHVVADTGIHIGARYGCPPPPPSPPPPPHH